MLLLGLMELEVRRRTVPLVELLWKKQKLKQKEELGLDLSEVLRIGILGLDWWSCLPDSEQEGALNAGFAGAAQELRMMWRVEVMQGSLEISLDGGSTVEECGSDPLYYWAAAGWLAGRSGCQQQT